MKGKPKQLSEDAPLNLVLKISAIFQIPIFTGIVEWCFVSNDFAAVQETARKERADKKKLEMENCPAQLPYMFISPRSNECVFRLNNQIV